MGSSRDFGDWRRGFLSRGGGGGAGGGGAPVAHGQALALRYRVIFRASIVGIKEFLEPLQKLKVILEPTLHQFVNGNYLQKKKSGVK